MGRYDRTPQQLAQWYPTGQGHMDGPLDSVSSYRTLLRDWWSSNAALSEGAIMSGAKVCFGQSRSKRYACRYDFRTCVPS
jgi:hypothetical protein